MTLEERMGQAMSAFEGQEQGTLRPGEELEHTPHTA